MKASNGPKKLRLWLGTWFADIGCKVASADAIEGAAEIKSSEWNAVSFERYRWLRAALIMAVEEPKWNICFFS